MMRAAPISATRRSISAIVSPLRYRTRRTRRRLYFRVGSAVGMDNLHLLRGPGLAGFEHLITWRDPAFSRLEAYSSRSPATACRRRIQSPFCSLALSDVEARLCR